MATIKSYTDIEQSHKLAGILPNESADMHSEAVDDEGDMVFIIVDGLGDKTKPNYGSPVWSLAALLDVLPNGTNISTPDPLNKVRYSCWNDYDITYASNPIDACVAMIERLHELKML